MPIQNNYDNGYNFFWNNLKFKDKVHEYTMSCGLGNEILPLNWIFSVKL